MQEDIKLKAPEVGVLISGHAGRYGATELIRLAQEYGFGLDTSDSNCVARYEDGEFDPTGELDETILWISEDAEDFLNDHVAEEGYMFSWYEGEFYYQPMLWWTEDDYLTEDIYGVTC